MFESRQAGPSPSQRTSLSSCLLGLFSATDYTSNVLETTSFKLRSQTCDFVIWLISFGLQYYAEDQHIAIACLLKVSCLNFWTSGQMSCWFSWKIPCSLIGSSVLGCYSMPCSWVANQSWSKEFYENAVSNKCNTCSSNTVFWLSSDIPNPRSHPSNRIYAIEAEWRTYASVKKARPSFV